MGGVSEEAEWDSGGSEEFRGAGGKQERGSMASIDVGESSGIKIEGSEKGCRHVGLAGSGEEMAVEQEAERGYGLCFIDNAGEEFGSAGAKFVLEEGCKMQGNGAVAGDVSKEKDEARGADGDKIEKIATGKDVMLAVIHLQ